MTQIKGIDVYQGDGTVDWSKVKADGVQFAFIKATQGIAYKYVDYFRNNAPQALGAGIDVGAYHYATFSTVPEAISQAKYFVSVIKDFKLNYPAVLDLEENKENINKKQLTDAAIAFLEYLENAGYFAMLYTYDNFLDEQLDESRLTPYAQWIARYGNKPKNRSDIWQWTDKGTVNGINHAVDMNWSYRDFAAEIAAKQPVPPVQDVKASNQIGVLTVTADSLDVRDKPDDSGNVVSQITKDKSFKVYDAWYNVGAGWVSGNYVTFKKI